MIILRRHLATFPVPLRHHSKSTIFIWLFGPTSCAVNTIPWAERQIAVTDLCPGGMWLKKILPPCLPHPSASAPAGVRGGRFFTVARWGLWTLKRDSLSLSSLLFSPSGHAAPTAGKQEQRFAATTKPRTWAPSLFCSAIPSGEQEFVPTQHGLSH
jgi:hypothetical protein